MFRILEYFRTLSNSWAGFCSNDISSDTSQKIVIEIKLADIYYIFD